MGKFKVVTVGGGSGHYVLLSSLRDVKSVDVTAIVSMTDSGGSTGRLRDELGVLPPGDILKCIIALSPYRDMAREIFQMRFSGDSKLSGHNAGNLLLSYFSQHTGKFGEGVKALSEMLRINGTVIPVTTDRTTLVAMLEDGERIYGEAAIDQPRGRLRSKIKEVFIVPHHSDRVEVYQPVLGAIAMADYIIIGPGDLFTSILPNLMVPGVAQALEQTRAKIVYISNIMTKFGETDGYDLEMFIRELEKNIRRSVDLLIVNDRRPCSKFVASYAAEEASLVEADLPAMYISRTIKADLLDDQGDVLRHSDEKLFELFSELFATPK
ncbi:MAG: gluconeogenesis factor YvcK family protein [bacterium]